ncbi:hypothetical protein [Thalassospira sp. HJ]|uniref:hypothetical protein n=1 Tax=Thalassospira sp. HJ TaxID=1616823 RepID=UPI001269ABE6|nr:hypothetical protein [Thalassospira sp. HJ]
MTHTPLVATTNIAPVSGASVWRWLALFARKWVNARKLSRDMEFLRAAPRERLEDIGIERRDIDIICREGRQS